VRYSIRHGIPTHLINSRLPDYHRFRNTRREQNGLSLILPLRAGTQLGHGVHYHRVVLAPYGYVAQPGLNGVMNKLTILHITIGQGESFNPGKYLEETSPYLWALLGISLCLGMSVVGAGW
jgi:hypothetical protein